jgi:selenophosphate synthetase-related protein
VLHAVAQDVVPAGVAAFDDPGGPPPRLLTAVTVNVYVVPLLRLANDVVVAGGEPVTVFEPWTVHPSYAVIT